ncbi:hypothetical protein VNO80_21723 [Phaseolus coccineus]|uniref:Uncharacterized protein n=1 Tax=Phaseolus coccineus TaxID=3886 RepID=A0AAN9QUA9_PHACN
MNAPKNYSALFKEKKVMISLRCKYICAFVLKALPDVIELLYPFVINFVNTVRRGFMVVGRCLVISRSTYLSSGSYFCKHVV